VRRIDNAWVSSKFNTRGGGGGGSHPSNDDDREEEVGINRGGGASPPPPRVRGLFCVAPPRSLERLVAFGRVVTPRRVSAWLYMDHTGCHQFNRAFTAKYK
jgi:hypothetical protein